MAEIKIAGTLHNTEEIQGDALHSHVVAQSDEILDATLGKKQSEFNDAVNDDINGQSQGLKNRLSTLEQQVSFDGDFQAENTPAGVIAESGKIVTANAARGAIDVRTGYFVCDTAAATAAKAVTAGGFVLTGGGAIKIKMTNANTAASSVTLNINSTGAKTIYYNGEAVNASNTWEAGEVVEVYYDPSADSNAGAYYANNVAGGAGDGVFDLTAKTGDSYATLSAALTAANTAIPASKKKGGMSIKYVQTSDNNSSRYVQYRLMLSTFNDSQFTNEANWQGVDDGPTAGSKNLVESGGTYLQIKNIKDEIDALFQDRDGSSLYVADVDGNVVAQVDECGVHSVDVEGSGRKMSEMPVPLYDDALYITDADGNVIVTVDANGIRTIGFDSRGHFSPKFKSIQIKDTIVAGASLKSNPVQIEKDIFESAIIQGEIENVLFGLGMNEAGYDFYAHWLEITPTEVKLYRYTNELQLVQTYSHGITLTNKTVIVVDSTIVGNTKETTLKLYNDLGYVFTQSLPSWGVGACFVKNQNTSGELDVSLSLMPKRLTSKIWLFGDSYINFISNIRWPYYLAQLGHLDFFSNNCPGLSPTTGLASLEYILGLGYVPSILVWCLGMNGNGVENIVDGEYVINQEQKNVIDSVLSICKTYGITPILSTIPTVPNYQKTGLSNYVRSLGVRYIDFADAVGADSSGNWNDGLLSDDNVHPSALGAIVLASRVFADCPELTMI